MEDNQLNTSALSKEQIAERARVMAGVFKQLVTLNASAIGLIVVFADRFAGDHGLSQILLAFAPIAFLTSLFCSLMMMITMAMRQQPDDDMTPELDREETIVLWVATMGFSTGVLCLLLPAWFRFIGLLPAWFLSILSLGAVICAGWLLLKKIRSIPRP